MSIIRNVVIASTLALASTALVSTAPALADSPRADILETLQFSAYPHQVYQPLARADARGSMAFAPRAMAPGWNWPSDMRSAANP